MKPINLATGGNFAMKEAPVNDFIDDHMKGLTFEALHARGVSYQFFNTVGGRVWGQILDQIWDGVYWPVLDKARSAFLKQGLNHPGGAKT